MKLGKAALEALQAQVTGRLLPGDDIIVAGPIALSETVRLAQKEHTCLRTYFSRGFLYDAENLLRDYGIDMPVEESQIWQEAQKAGAHALYAMKDGGFLSALWIMAEASGTGLTADLRKVPIRQETIEICERFDLDPYRLASEGSLLIGISSGEDLIQSLGRLGIEAVIIGRVNTSNDRLLYSGENARYLERPRQKRQEGE